jgi:hypothetical protein
MSSLMAERIAWIASSCSSRRLVSRCSSSSSFHESTWFEESTSRNFTKARTTYTLISIARGVLSTMAAMMAPCSVNTQGRYRRPPLQDRRRLRLQNETSKPPAPPDDRERRAVDYERYCASLQLRELVHGLERRKCFFAKHENFSTVELDGAPAGHEYRVFFTVARDSADAVTLIVQSAYFARTEWNPQRAPGKPIPCIT